MVRWRRDVDKMVVVAVNDEISVDYKDPLSAERIKNPLLVWGSLCYEIPGETEKLTDGQERLAHESNKIALRRGPAEAIDHYSRWRYD